MNITPLQRTALTLLKEVMPLMNTDGLRRLADCPCDASHRC